MKHKTGLHKKVSSIFDGASLPRELTEPSLNKSNVPNETKFGQASPKIAEPGRQNSKPQNQQQTSWGQANKTLLKVEGSNIEDKEVDQQKKKLMLMIGLSILLIIILIFNFFKPLNKVTPIEIKETALAKQTKGPQINWADPGKWPADTRDPMVYGSCAPKTNSEKETLVIKGIVRPPKGRASVLIGTEILYEGDKFQDWIVKEIHQDAVMLEKSDGQRKELRWN
jgi:hypothetical protein